MPQYNTQLRQLSLPEYGRNIQRMIDHCMTIEDRQQRNACAYNIHRTMLTLFPPQTEPESYSRKLWDHIALMSDYKLDIDWPAGMAEGQPEACPPDKLPYPEKSGLWRQYGNAVRMTIEHIVAMPEGDERDTLTMLLACQMKKLTATETGESADDEKVFQDLYYMSGGRIAVYTEQLRLYDYRMAPQPKKKKKKI